MTKAMKVWNVKLTFQYPAWDEVDGIIFCGIVAPNKTTANAAARKKAGQDGHLFGGKGRTTFSATEVS